MSYYDYTPKSGYGHNSRSYKVETYVEEVRKPRVVEYRYPSYTYSYDRPPEVNDLITKILTEVNGPPASTTISDSGTYRGQRAPIRVKSKNYYTEDLWYSSYPSIRDYGSQYNDPNAIDHGVPKHRYQQPQLDLDYGHQPPKWDQREAYASKPETIKTFGVPRTYWGSSYQSDSPKYGGFQSQGAPMNQWGDAPMNSYARHDYGGVSNPSNFRPRDERDPHKRWGDSPAKGYRVPIYQYEDTPMMFHNDYAIPSNLSTPKPEMLQGQETRDSKSYDSPVKPYDYAGDYRDPDKSAKTQSRQDYGVPSIPQSPKDQRAPYSQWGGSPVKPQIRQDYEVPTKPETPKDQRGPYAEWGGSPNSSHNAGKYGVPNNKQNLSSAPNAYQHPENKSRNSPVNSPKFRGYGDPNDHPWDSPSKQVYRQPPNTQFASDPKTYVEQDYSPMKQQTHPNYTTPSNPWDKPSNHSDESQLLPQPQTPPSMTCKDGVCTLDDKPKVTHNPYDEPKDDYIRNHPKDTAINHVQNDGRSSPYTLENQPKKDQQNTSANWMNSPSVHNNNARSYTPLGKATNNNIEEPLGKLNITEASSPNHTTLTSPRVGLSAPIHSRPKSESPKESTRTNIDSKEVEKRYGGLSFPSRPYSSGEDQSKAISSVEALEKYNGSIVPK